MFFKRLLGIDTFSSTTSHPRQVEVDLGVKNLRDQDSHPNTTSAATLSEKQKNKNNLCSYSQCSQTFS